MDQNAIGAWLRQSTTGQGMAGLLTTLLALSQGAVTLQQAVPAVVACIVLIVWPQNTALAASVKTVATDLEPVLLAYRTGLTHGQAIGAAALPQSAAAPIAAISQPPVS